MCYLKLHPTPVGFAQHFRLVRRHPRHNLSIGSSARPRGPADYIRELSTGAAVQPTHLPPFVVNDVGDERVLVRIPLLLLRDQLTDVGGGVQRGRRLVKLPEQLDVRGQELREVLELNRVELDVGVRDYGVRRGFARAHDLAQLRCLNGGVRELRQTLGFQVIS